MTDRELNLLVEIANWIFSGDNSIVIVAGHDHDNCACKDWSP